METIVQGGRESGHVVTFRHCPIECVCHVVVISEGLSRLMLLEIFVIQIVFYDPLKSESEPF